MGEIFGFLNSLLSFKTKSPHQPIPLKQTNKKKFEMKQFPLTHEVGDGLAHGASEDEVLQDVGDQGEWHAEDGHHEVADGQRQQEGVGDGPHALVQHQDHDDQQVAEDAEQEDERVEQDAQRVHL